MDMQRDLQMCFLLAGPSLFFCEYVYNIREKPLDSFEVTVSVSSYCNSLSCLREAQASSSEQEVRQLHGLIGLCYKLHFMSGVKITRREEIVPKPIYFFFQNPYQSCAVLSANHESLKTAYTASTGNLKHNVLFCKYIWKKRRIET